MMTSAKKPVRWQMGLLAACALAALPLQAWATGDDVMLELADDYYLEDNFQEAFDIWQPLADAGNVEAQMALADAAQYCDCLPDGIGTALEYFEKAGAQGNVVGYQKMGWIYAVQKHDKAQAAKYYKIAADKGDAESQMELGDLYRDGFGGATTLPLMSKYYHLAAAQGNRNGYARLARLYSEGKQVKADPIRAYVAQSMAVSLSFPMAKEHLPEFEKKLSAKQLIKAKVLADKCVKAKYLNCL